MIAGLIAFLSFAAVARQTKDGKWIDLFNGKDTIGWRMAGKGNFTLEDGALVTHGGMGMRGTRGQVCELHFGSRVESRQQGNNSGVFIRFPEKNDTRGMR